MVGVALEQGAEHQQPVQCLALRCGLGGAQQADHTAGGGILGCAVAAAVAHLGQQTGEHIGHRFVADVTEDVDVGAHVVGQPGRRGELHPVGHLVQAHPEAEIARLHPEGALHRHDVRRHQQQGAVAAGERIVLTEDRGGQEGQHGPGLHARRFPGECPAALADPGAGELGHRIGRRADPARPVDDARLRDRFVVEQTGHLTDRCFGAHRGVGEFADHLFGGVPAGPRPGRDERGAGAGRDPPVDGTGQPGAPAALPAVSTAPPPDSTAPESPGRCSVVIGHPPVRSIRNYAVWPRWHPMRVCSPPAADRSTSTRR